MTGTSPEATNLADTAAVSAANAELYAAIEAGDIARLEAVWDVTDDVVCVHPGWAAVRGRSHVSRSWAIIMANTAYIQFFLTGVEVEVAGDVAVVSCEHSLIARVSDKNPDAEFGETARVVATNVFRRRGERWRLWAHHASPVMTAEETVDES